MLRVMLYYLTFAFWTPLCTRLLIGVWFLFGCLFDVMLAIRFGNDATLSKQMQWIGLNWRIVLVACGGLMCHFFVPKGKGISWWDVIEPACCLALGFISFFVAWRQSLPPG